MKWHVYFYIPYTQELGSGFDSLAEAIKEVESIKSHYGMLKSYRIASESAAAITLYGKAHG